MDYVSLLPPEIKKRRLDESKQAVMVRIVMVLFLLIMVVYVYLLVSTFMARNDLKILRQERENVEMQVAQLAEYEIIFNNLVAAETRLNSAMGSVPIWEQFLQDIGLTLPPGVTLTDMTLTYDTENGTLNMRGWTYSHRDVGDMLDLLNTVEQLNEVRCRVSTETTVGSQDAVSFTVDAVLLPGPPFLTEIETEVASDDVPEEEGS